MELGGCWLVAGGKRSLKWVFVEDKCGVKEFIKSSIMGLMNVVSANCIFCVKEPPGLVTGKTNKDSSCCLLRLSMVGLSSVSLERGGTSKDAVVAYFWFVAESQEVWSCWIAIVIQQVLGGKDINDVCYIFCCKMIKWFDMRVCTGMARIILLMVCHCHLTMEFIFWLWGAAMEILILFLFSHSRNSRELK